MCIGYVECVVDMLGVQWIYCLCSGYFGFVVDMLCVVDILSL